MFEELSFEDTITHLEVMEDEEEIQVPVHSMKMYEVIQEVAQKVHEARVLTKYKTVEKKARPFAAPLPGDSERAIKEVATRPMLRDPRKVGHVFTPETIQRMKIRGGGCREEYASRYKNKLKYNIQ